MTDLNQIATTIDTLLTQEESKPIKTRTDVWQANLRRREIESHITTLQNALSDIQRRKNRLSHLPEEEHMDWAEAVLDMPNLAIVVLDTTSLNYCADIIRIYAMNQQGTICDILIRPGREKGANTQYTGISQEEIDLAPPIQEVWPRVLSLLKGHYIISYGLEFAESHLAENIRHYGLDRLPLRGECLMEQAKTYFGVNRYDGIRLAAAVYRIGRPFPDNPPTADMRAHGCLALLLAMCSGITSAPEPSKEVSSDTLEGPLTIVHGGDNVEGKGADIVLDVLANINPDDQGDHPF